MLFFSKTKMIATLAMVALSFWTQQGFEIAPVILDASLP